MPDQIRITVNGASVAVPTGCTVAAAVLIAGESATRRSVSGQPRGPLCGMGICFECRVSIDGVAHTRSCQTICRDGMEVRTDAA